MIYLLEDDDSIRKLVLYGLDSQGFQAKGFALPSEFWRAMDAELPELVLLDIMLPEEDGLSILKKLRARPATKRLPIIMLTAKNSEYDRVIGLDHGADDFVSKPFSMLELIARIRAAVNNKRSYARERLYTHMCCCEDFAVPRLGEEADAERIHYRKLTMRYHDLLSTSPVEIFYCGSLEGGRVARILTDVLSTMPRGEIDEDIGTDIRMNALEAEPRYVTETLPVAQGQLAVGYRLGACMTEPDIPALFVFNALYGGCVSRSIGYIAKQNENTYKPGTAGYKYIHEIIDAVYGKTEQGGETK